MKFLQFFESDGDVVYVNPEKVVSVGYEQRNEIKKGVFRHSCRIFFGVVGGHSGPDSYASQGLCGVRVFGTCDEVSEALTKDSDSDTYDFGWFDESGNYVEADKR